MRTLRTILTMSTALLLAFAISCEREPAQPAAGSPRFSTVSAESVVSESISGEYTDLTASNIGEIAGHIRIAENEATDAAALEAWAATLANRLMEGLVLQNFEGLSSLGASDENGNPISEVIQHYQNQSPNFHWKSINLEHSKVEILNGGSDGKLKSLPEFQASSAVLAREMGRPIYIRIEFHVGHLLEGRNMVVFGFLQDWPDGDPMLARLMHSNLLTVQNY
ncbi:MAG: hypothetical protein SF028_02220 [Candidatus Sumerlaeia bacterium]|nr:hypothetical protein [Candidatus Sumerlaeia bacterium]